MSIGEHDTCPYCGHSNLIISKNDAAVKSLVEAANALLARDEMNTCQHEETYRGGCIWEICSQCEDRWADDRGGKPKWQDPPEWTSIRQAIEKVEGL